MSHRSLLIIGLCLELLYLSFYVVAESANEVLLFLVVNGGTFLLYSYVVFRLQTLPPVLEKTLIPLVLGFAILFRLTLVFHPPVASDDIYRYVWDGKVAAHGINPFAYAPTDSALANLRTEDLPSKINFPSMRTIYPPLAQIFFFFSNTLFGDSVTGLKTLLVLADITSVLILALLFRLHVKHISLYAWSPLPILYFGLDGHVDALGIPLFLLFLFFVRKSKFFSAAVSLGLSGLAKLYPLFIAPFLLQLSQGRKKFILAAVPVALFLAGCWLYWEPTGGLVESFIVFNSTFEFNGSLFNILYSIIGSNEKAHLVSALLFLIWWGIVFILKRPLLERVFLVFLGFIVCAPTVHPWYLTWLAVILTLRWSTAVFVLLGLSAMTNWVVYEYRSSGVWDVRTWLLLIEYIPFYSLLAWEIAKGKFSREQVAFS